MSKGVILGLPLAKLCCIFMVVATVANDPDTNQWRLDIASPKQSDRDRVVAEISQELQADKINSGFYGALRDQLLPGMMRVGMYEQVASLGMTAALENPGLSRSFLLLRTQALLAANHPDDALISAKMFFNVCMIPETEKSVDLVKRCLVASKGKVDPEIGRKFEREEEAGATTKPSSTQAPYPTSSILASIKIEPELIEPFISKYDGSDFGSVKKRGTCSVSIL